MAVPFTSPAEKPPKDDRPDAPDGLRDAFAMAAMRSLIEGSGGPKFTTAADLARHAYAIAEAMIAARN